jgi:hypothetical protein
MKSIHFRSRISGADLRKELQRARENEQRLRSCRKHTFKLLSSAEQARYLCAHCGGQAEGDYMRAYCEGVRAAGGDPLIVCANFEADA